MYDIAFLSSLPESVQRNSVNDFMHLYQDNWPVIWWQCYTHPSGLSLSAIYRACLCLPISYPVKSLPRIVYTAQETDINFDG